MSQLIAQSPILFTLKNTILNVRRIVKGQDPLKRASIPYNPREHPRCVSGPLVRYQGDLVLVSHTTRLSAIFVSKPKIE